MGAGISTTIPESRLTTYPPTVTRTTRAFQPPLPPPQKLPTPPPLPPQKLPPPPPPINTPAAANNSRVNVFHSSARWRAYFESSKSSNKLIVIDFTAAWYGPCKLIEPFFNELSAKYTDVDFVKIDVDELMDVGMQFGIQAMPTFLFLKRGQEVDRVVGVKKEELHNKVDKHRLDIDANNYGYYY